MLDIVLYRLFRCRRVIVLGVLPLIAAYVALGVHGVSQHENLFCFSALIVVAHAVRYPNNWTETLSVSLPLAVCLSLATTVPPDMAMDALLMRVLALVFLWLVLFFVLVCPMANLVYVGPVSTAPVGATAHSHLNAKALHKSLTYYPGRKDDYVVCGDADAEGRFPVTFRQAFELPTYDGGAPDVIREVGCDDDGILETQAHAVISSTGPDHHDIFFFEPGSDDVTASSYRFIQTKSGTRVVMQEVGQPLQTGMRFGMWVSDFLGDYLQTHIDKAEGRTPRANKSFAHKQLVTELANVIVPILNFANGEPTNNDKT